MRGRLVLCAVGVLVVAVYVAGIGHTLAETDEVIYAEFVRSMHDSGDYFSLTWEGHAVHQRPAAPVALYAAAAAVVPGEFGLRLIPTLMSIAAAVLCGFIVWRRSSCIESACTAMLFCAGIVSYFTYGRMIFSDPPFVVAITLALAATIAAQRDPRFILWACAGLGLAFATKSLAAGIPTLALLPWLVRALRRHRGTGGLRLGWSVAAFVLLAGPFYIMGVARFGGEFLDLHFGYNLGQRAAGIEGIGLGGPLSYLQHLWDVDGPVAFALVLGAPLASAAIGIRARDSDYLVAPTLALGSLAMLSVIGTRLPHYLLPIYPASAVCVGMVAAAAAAWLRHRNPLAPVLLPVAALAFFATGITAPVFDESHLPATEARALGVAAADAVDPGQPVYALDWYCPSLGYYANRPWRLLTTSPRMRDIVASIDIFASSNTVAMVPPFPDASPFIVAADAARLAAVPDLIIVRELARKDDYVLAEVQARAVLP